MFKFGETRPLSVYNIFGSIRKGIRFTHILACLPHHGVQKWKAVCKSTGNIQAPLLPGVHSGSSATASGRSNGRTGHPLSTARVLQQGGPTRDTRATMRQGGAVTWHSSPKGSPLLPFCNVTPKKLVTSRLIRAASPLHPSTEKYGTAHGSCDEILRKDLNMRRVSAKFVPRLLTEDQRRTTSSDLFQNASDDPEFMKLIITGDESWVYGYDPETKQQSSPWKPPGSPRPKKARPKSC
ncbi:uncharacterized protein TNCV_5061531 [Trichonephila clavipes]|nr:uncharacterized protein TNCV_5061531 [Trichonephila clavipes]